LLEAGADIHAQDKNGATPLHRAVRTRSAAAVQFLLDAGADPAIKNKPGSTPFHLAVQNTGRGGSGAEKPKPPSAKSSKHSSPAVCAQSSRASTERASPIPPAPLGFKNSSLEQPKSILRNPFGVLRAVFAAQLSSPLKITIETSSPN
jgi:hypothetical protein